jgi:hypothetical protein
VSGESAIELAAPVDAAGLEVPPPTVAGNVERRVAEARDRRDSGGGRIEMPTLDAEMARKPGVRRGEDVGAALADRRRPL